MRKVMALALAVTVLALCLLTGPATARANPSPPANVANVAPEVAEPATDVTAALTVNRRDATTADVATARSINNTPSVADADSSIPSYVLRL